MAVEGFALQAGTYGAEVTRRWVGALLQRGATVGSIEGGLVGATDCAITIGSGLHLKVAAGEAFVAGTSSASQGGYYLRNTASAELTLAAANETNPRVDRISAIIKDKAYTGTEDTFSVAVETGTPTSGANLTNLSGAAAAPTSSLTLGYALVPAKATTPSEVLNVASPFAAQGAMKLPHWVGSITLQIGEVAQVEGGVEVKLPRPASGAECGVVVTSGTTAATVKITPGSPQPKIIAAGAQIETLKVYPNGAVRFLSDGENWFMVGDGLAMSTPAAPTTRVLGGEYAPADTTRLTLVTLSAWITAYTSGYTAVLPQVNRGGVYQSVGRMSLVGLHAGAIASFWVAPGEKWYIGNEIEGTNTVTLQSSERAL
jgi:hypothetical protein